MKTAIKIAIIVVVILVLLAAVSVFSGGTAQPKNTTLIVFHAGSLASPLAKLEKVFEASHPNVDVQMESAGSVETIRKVTDLGKSADIIGSADYSLIDSMLMPDYADFNIKFASNAIAIAYTNHSKYRDELNNKTWMDILRRSDVRYGLSNGNLDPCGYRTLMTLQLAEKYYGDANIFEDLIANHTNIYINTTDGNSTIYIPQDITQDSRVMVRPKEVDLMAQLESGEIDYLFIYHSVAYQQKSSGVSDLKLPDEIDLSNVNMADAYGKVKVVQYADLSNKTQTVVAMPIAYGITVLKNAPHYDLALEFVKLLLSEKGRQIFTDDGQMPISPPISSGKVPAGLY